MPCLGRYSGWKDNLLVAHNADQAHDEGFTGREVRVGIIDRLRLSNYPTIENKVEFEWDPFPNNDQSTHGNRVAAVLAGSAVGSFTGGIAPDVRLYWAEPCSNNSCSDSNYRTAFNTLMDRGVRLFNHSRTLTGTAQTMTRFFSPLLGSNALMVAATGNEGRNEAAGMALLPTANPEFFQHLIVATGVHVNAAGQLIKYDNANQCGAAADWCVTAVSTSQIPRLPGIQLGTGEQVPGDDSLMRVNGTSMSTAVVSGVAAMVMEAYPWMSASNVQQTVLTTARDIGAAGVDPVYGWGLVDARKAVNGPAQFVSNQYLEGFVADIEGESRAFSNDISGAGWLRKRGAGSLTLTGNNTWTGGTLVETGTLRVTGSLGSDVEVAPGATFATGGNGARIDGHYDAYNAESWNEGRPASERKTGMATTAIQLGAPLSVTGEADITDSRLMLLPEVEGYSVQTRETLITADKGLYGKFKDVAYGSGFFWNANLDYGTNMLSATLTRAQAQVRAMSIGAPQQVVDGAGIADALIGYTDGLVLSGQVAGNEAIVAQAAALMSAANDEMAALSLSSLTGDIHSAARALGVQRAFNDGERLATRLRARNDPGVWLQHGGGNGYLDRAGYASAEVHHDVLGVGMDTPVGAAVLGLAASRSRSSAHLDMLGGRLDGSGQQFAMYARAGLGETGYLLGLVSHDRHTIKTQRRVLLGRSLDSVSGQHLDTALLTRLETGVTLKSGVTPYIAAGMLSLHQGGFTESGVLGLDADTNRLSKVFYDVGARVERHLGRWSVSSTLSSRRMSANETGFNAAFSGAETAVFAVQGRPWSRNSTRFASEFDYRARTGWQYSLSLGGEENSGQRRNAWAEMTIRMGL